MEARGVIVSAPGIYDMAEADYHADCCPAPSLSSSIARELLVYSPQHAWFAHPRLNPAYQREDEEKFDLGRAAHAYLLEGKAKCVIVEEKDWKKDVAKAAKLAAYAAGKIPLLADRWGDVQAMALAATRQLDAHEDSPRPLAGGKPEQTLVWQEEGIWLRARLDWLHDGRRFIDDYKSTQASANPDAFTRTLFNMGYDVQAAFYLRGLQVLTGIASVTFRFVVQESFAPYALSVIGLGPEALEIGARKVGYAIRLWRECVARDVWPGYPTATCWADAPPWEVARWLEQEIREGAKPAVPVPILDDGRTLDEQLFGEKA